MHPVIYEQKKLNLIGLKKNFTEMQPLLARALWQQFLPRLKEIENITGDYCYGVVIPSKNTTEYFCGVEVSSLAQIPEGMVAYSVPAATYAKFKHMGPVSSIGRTVHSIYGKWLSLCDWKHTQGPDLEIYEFDYNPSSDNSYMYYAIPINT